MVLLAAATAGREMMAANPFFADAPPPLPFVAWAVLWIILVLAAGAIAFRRREL
jgi:hypothetical protein